MDINLKRIFVLLLIIITSGCRGTKDLKKTNTEENTEEKEVTYTIMEDLINDSAETPLPFGFDISELFSNISGEVTDQQRKEIAKNLQKIKLLPVKSVTNKGIFTTSLQNGKLSNNYESIGGKKTSINYKEKNTARKEEVDQESKPIKNHFWLGVAVAIITVGLIFFFIIFWRRKKKEYNV